MIAIVAGTLLSRVIELCSN